jgi:hypothetical protein
VAQLLDVCIPSGEKATVLLSQIASFHCG